VQRARGAACSSVTTVTAPATRSRRATNKHPEPRWWALVSSSSVHGIAFNDALQRTVGMGIEALAAAALYW
jgi:hypothetical protein